MVVRSPRWVGPRSGFLVMEPVKPPLVWLHVSGQAGVRRAGRPVRTKPHVALCHPSKAPRKASPIGRRMRGMMAVDGTIGCQSFEILTPRKQAIARYLAV